MQNIDYNKDKFSDYKNILSICTFLAILNIISLIYPTFSYVVFIVALVFLLFNNINDSILILFFLLPFASIMKYKLGDISFFSYLMIFFIFIYLFKNYKKEMRYQNLAILGILTAYTMLNNFHLIRMANIIVGCLVLFFIIGNLNDKLMKKIIIIFSLGIILTSFISLLESQFPRLNELLDYNEYWTEEGYVRRFSGFENDPNYYTINIILVLSSLSVLLHKKEIKEYLFYIIVIPLSICGFLTLSKSFLLMFMLFSLIYLYIIAKKDKKRAFLTAFILFAIGLIMIRIIGFNPIIITINRLIASFSSQFDLNVILTGRYVIWQNYWQEINRNIISLFFGNGIGANYVNGRASHSAYIETLYHFGIIGTIIIILNFIALISSSNRKLNLRIINFTPLFFLLASMFALDLIMSDKIYFYVIIASGLLFRSKEAYLLGLKEY